MERARRRGSIRTNCFDSLQVVSCIDFIQTAQQGKKDQMRHAAWVCFEWLLLGLGKNKQKHCCIMMEAALELRPSSLVCQWRSIMLKYLGARASYNWVLNRIFVSISARMKRTFERERHSHVTCFQQWRTSIMKGGQKNIDKLEAKLVKCSRMKGK